MTRRRDLEQAVIKDAQRLGTEMWTNYLAVGHICNEQIDSLLRALDKSLTELHKLREIEKPRANRVAPITSHQAAQWVGEHSQKSMLGRIFYRIYWYSRHDWMGQRGDGQTADELIREGIGSHQTVSARVNELVNAGWIVDSGRTRKTRSGREAIVWIPSPAARQAVEDGRQP